MLPGNFMEQLQVMKAQMEEAKKRLDATIVEGHSPQHKVIVKVSGNRQVKSVDICEDLAVFEKEELEDHLTIALNAALEKAEAVYEKEMKGAAGSMMPGWGI